VSLPQESWKRHSITVDAPGGGGVFLRSHNKSLDTHNEKSKLSNLNTSVLSVCVDLLPRMANDSGIFTTAVRIPFYNSWKQKLWKIGDVLFRILSMTNSFQYNPRVVLSLQFSTGPSKLFEFPEIVSRSSFVGGA